MIGATALDALPLKGKYLINHGAERSGKEVKMDEDMNTSEKIEELAKANRTWEILEILKTCKDLEEATEKVRALLNK